MSNFIKQQMSLNVLTALHIGGADYKSTLHSSEYVYNSKNRELTLIDSTKFMGYLTEKNLLDKFLEYIQRKVNSAQSAQKRKIKLEDFINEYGIRKDIGKFSKCTYTDMEINVNNDIKLLVRNAYDEPYVPGSSIKGAIVNSLLVDHILRNYEAFDIERREIFRLCKNATAPDRKIYDLLRKQISLKIKNLENDILYVISGNIKRFWLSVSDTYDPQNLGTDFLQDYDEPHKEDSSERKMPLIREYITAGTSFTFDITMDSDLLQKTKLQIKSPRDILDAIENSSKYLTTQVLGTQKELDLILGANTGYHQKTIIHALFKNDRERLEVVKKLLHTPSKNPKDRQMKNHLNDRFAPRVINRIEMGSGFDLAGIVQLTAKGEARYVGKA